MRSSRESIIARILSHRAQPPLSISVPGQLFDQRTRPPLEVEKPHWGLELEGGRRMYISRGVGHLFRVRFNVRPEVTVFTLKAA